MQARTGNNVFSTSRACFGRGKKNIPTQLLQDQKLVPPSPNVPHTVVCSAIGRYSSNRGKIKVVTIASMYNQNAHDEADGSVSEFFYGSFIRFNVTWSPFYK